MDLPTFTEVFGEPKTGKTHESHTGWPNPIHIDLASVRLEFGDHHVPQQQKRGDAWPTLLHQVYGGDAEAADEHYQFVDAYEQLESIDVSEYDTVIIDDSVQLKGLAKIDYVEEKGGGSVTQREWGNIHSRVRNACSAFEHTHHVVLISRMTDEYRNDTKTGNRERKSGLKDAEYHCDFQVELRIDNGDRVGMVHENRFGDKADDSQVREIPGGVSLDDLLTLCTDIDGK